MKNGVEKRGRESFSGMIVAQCPGARMEASLSLRYLVSGVPTKDWPAHSLRAQGCSLAFCKA